MADGGNIKGDEKLADMLSASKTSENSNNDTNTNSNDNGSDENDDDDENETAVLNRLIYLHIIEKSFYKFLVTKRYTMIEKEIKKLGVIVNDYESQEHFNGIKSYFEIYELKSSMENDILRFIYRISNMTFDLPNSIAIKKNAKENNKNNRNKNKNYNYSTSDDNMINIVKYID